MRPKKLSAMTLLIFLVSSGSGTIVINEVELNPAGDDRSQDVLEWVELYNTGNEDAVISDWSLVTTHGDKEIAHIPPRTTIPAKGFYIQLGPEIGEQWLDNQYESIVLNDRSGSEVDMTPTLTDDRDDSCAWSRYPDGSPDWGFMISSKGIRASGDFCYSGRYDDALSCCFGKYDDGSLWNVSCLNAGDQPDSCLIEDPFIESEECETSNEDECWIGQEEGATNASYYLKFEIDQVVSGVGFVNVDNGYYTIPFGDVISLELSTREHGSGPYESEERTRLLIENKSTKFDNISFNIGNASIEMDKDVSASYTTTTLGLPRNRSVTYSSTWTEEACSKSRMISAVVGSIYSDKYHVPWCQDAKRIKPENRIWFSSPGDAYAKGYRACLNCIQDNVTDTSMSESYRYATSIDRKSWIVRNQNRSMMVVDSEFDGVGHIGVLKLSDPGASVHGVPVIEVREDYIGSFKIYDRIDEENSSLTFNKSTSGTGFAATSKRIREGQKAYEYGTGSYDSEELIETETNYIAKYLNVTHSPANQILTDDVSINSSLRWKEGVWSRVRNTSFIGEEYTRITSLDKETVANGLNEIETKAEFSGNARYRAILRTEVDVDEQYEGDYSVHRRTIFTGIPKYDSPHLNVTKTGEIDLLNCSERSSIVSYTITVENDGNRALGPVYVKDLFPPGARFIDSSMRPSELTPVSANWTLPHLAIGDRSSINLWLDVVNCPDELLVNQAKATGGYNGDYWITGSSSCIVKRPRSK